MKVDTLREWRNFVVMRDRNKCRVCGDDGYNGGRLEAHHIVPMYADSRFRLETENGITLCAACHKNTHTSVRAYKNKFGYEPSLPDYEPGGLKY